jgi:tRNA threonylcarbamoyladenosine biosynthesis protein TsaB
MLILAIDTALDACSAGVLDTRAARIIAHESLAMRRGHAEALMPLVARVMRASGVSFGDLARVAVTTGPGSFTGLRVGLAAARGIGLAAQKPVVGLTTLAAYTAPRVAADGDSPVLAAIDARHGQVYVQFVDGEGAMLLPPRIASIAEAIAATRHEAAPCLVGNAAALLAGHWPADRAPPVMVEPEPAPDVAWVAWLGAAVRPETAPPKPTYLRAPDAVPTAARAVS